MKQGAFPIWFRVYVFIPVLGILYVFVPLFVWNFSPHALTHTTPVFLLGATDWGSGNIYTFTKIAYWIGLVFGLLANIRVVSKEQEATGSFLWKCRLNVWHFGAAFVIPLMALPDGVSTDTIDMWLLFGYFALSACFLLLLLTIAQQKGQTRYILVSLLIAIAWGFLPVSLGRP
ncbi:MAG: hypothetical protein EOM12_17065 [Verrucomicrobiae bacterium]|nr:hypothetical protein [Verrucomicrobiae bacterium]